jgi:cytochrome c-type biogenesis protein
MFGHPWTTRRTLYVVFAILALIPIAAFAIGPLSSSSFSLKGPAGPLLAFSAGVLSFVSPCVLPLVPIYLTHLSGASIVNGKVVADRRVTFTHALVFVSSFSLIFIALGTAAGLLGSYFLADHQRDLGEIAGMILVGMGILLIPSRGRKDPLRSALLLIGLTLVFLFLAEAAQLKGNTTRHSNSAAFSRSSGCASPATSICRCSRGPSRRTPALDGKLAIRSPHW